MDVRIGKISAIDYEHGMVSVAYGADGSATDMMPFLCFNNEYCMPKIGQMVVTLPISASRSVCMGSMWNQSNTPIDAKKDTYRKELAKDTYVLATDSSYELHAKEIILEDRNYRISLSDLMRRLEALDGDVSARKEV